MMASDNVYVSNTVNLAKYMKLDQKGKALAEYIWIDGNNGLRNKTKVSTPRSESTKCLVLPISTLHPVSNARFVTYPGWPIPRLASNG